MVPECSAEGEYCNSRFFLRSAPAEYRPREQNFDDQLLALPRSAAPRFVLVFVLVFVVLVFVPLVLFVELVFLKDATLGLGNLRRQLLRLARPHEDLFLG